MRTSTACALVLSGIAAGTSATTAILLLFNRRRKRIHLFDCTAQAGKEAKIAQVLPC